MLFGFFLVLFAILLALFGGGGANLACSSLPLPTRIARPFTEFQGGGRRSIQELASPSQVDPNSARAKLLPGRSYFAKMTRSQAQSRKSPESLLSGREGGKVRFSSIVKVQEIERVVK